MEDKSTGDVPQLKSYKSVGIVKPESLLISNHSIEFGIEIKDENESHRNSTTLRDTDRSQEPRALNATELRNTGKSSFAGSDAGIQTYTKSMKS